MNDISHFQMARKALKKLYPSWLLFIDEVMDLIQPFWLGLQSKEQAHFIHLIGYGKRQKAKEIIIDLLEFLDWQSDSIFLLQNWDLQSPSSFVQVVDFQESYRVFPKVVVTDFFSEFLDLVNGEAATCSYLPQFKTFLKERKELQLFDESHPSSDGRGSLIISFLDFFGDQDFIQTRLLLKFLWNNPIEGFNQLRKTFVPEEMQRMIEKEYVKQEELIFFSKDRPFHAQMAFDLQAVTSVLAGKGSELLSIPVSISFNAMDYFLAYVFYKKLNYSKLLQAGFDFFLPVFSQYASMTRRVNLRPEKLELDFKGGWKFNLIMD